jgi:hypothetical protein
VVDEFDLEHPPPTVVAHSENRLGFDRLAPHAPMLARDSCGPGERPRFR